jgi:hypothetical protein
MQQSSFFGALQRTKTQRDNHLMKCLHYYSGIPHLSVVLGSLPQHIHSSVPARVVIDFCSSFGNPS